jgi:hypothetical protein
MTPEPRNYFYDLLIPASVLFVVTVLAYALVPPDRQPDWLYAHGWKLLLGEVGLIVVLGLLSMGYDRWLTVRRQPPSLPRSEVDSPQGG